VPVRRIITVFAALLIAAGCTLVATTPAHASLSQCGVGYLCLWSSPNYGGSIHKIPLKPKGYCYNVPGGFNDIADSAYNNYTGFSKRWVQYYQNAGCTGHLLHNDAYCEQGPWEPGVAATPKFFTHESPETGGNCGTHFNPYHDVNILTSVFFNTN
jgi:hypothetical protein